MERPMNQQTKEKHNSQMFRKWLLKTSLSLFYNVKCRHNHDNENNNNNNNWSGYSGRMGKYQTASCSSHSRAASRHVGTSLLHAHWLSHALAEPVMRQVQQQRWQLLARSTLISVPLHLWANCGRDLGRIQCISPPPPWWSWKEDLTQLWRGERDQLPVPEDLSIGAVLQYSAGHCWSYTHIIFYSIFKLPRDYIYRGQKIEQNKNKTKYNKNQNKTKKQQQQLIQQLNNTVDKCKQVTVHREMMTLGKSNKVSR